MQRMIVGALLMAGALTLAPRAGVSSDATGDGTEIRVFVLDKSGQPVDIKNWTGAVDVMPVRGQRKAFKLEPVAGKAEGLKEDLKEGARDLKEGAKDLKEGAKGYQDEKDRTWAEGKDPMLCGQAKELDDWYVEMVVLRPGMPFRKGGEGTREDDAKKWDKGFSHTHGSGYFKANVDEATIKDTKTGVVNFKATVVFTLPNGDTKYVKGFAYPEGVIEDVLGRILDKDLKDTSKLDHEQAAMAARKTQMVLHSLPPLSFKDNEDRQEFEKAKQDCMAACHRMEQATGKDISDSADKCKSALKEVRSQAKDAQGALTAE
jgi:hypothetical protein